MAKGKETKIDEVANELVRRIQEAVYVAGQPLPSELKLAEELGVSRPTVRAALLRLEAENRVRIVPRAGAFVRPRAAQITLGATETERGAPRMQGRSGTLALDLHLPGRTAQLRFVQHPRFLEAAAHPDDLQLFHKLGLVPSTDEGFLHRVYVRLLDGIPYHLLDELVRVPGLLQQDLAEHLAWERWVETIQRHVAWVVEHAQARMPTMEEAALLALAPTQPVLELEQWAWMSASTTSAAEGTSSEVGEGWPGFRTDMPPLRYTRMVANAAFHKLVYRLKISPEGIPADC